MLAYILFGVFVLLLYIISNYLMYYKPPMLPHKMKWLNRVYRIRRIGTYLFYVDAGLIAVLFIWTLIVI